jgi:hypothetical protein
MLTMRNVAIGRNFEVRHVSDKLSAVGICNGGYYLWKQFNSCLTISLLENFP